MLDDFCNNCWNEGCKKAPDKFREDKLPICKALSELEEDDDDDFLYPFCDDEYE